MKYFVALILGAFLLAGCSDEPDVVTLESGVRYVDDSLGTGNAAKAGDIVSVHFEAWLIKDSTNLYSDWSKDTTKLAQSIGNSKIYKQPVKFKLGSNQFIPKVDEAIVGMKIGGRRTVIIPSGPEGLGPVPANSIFKVVIELVSAKEVAPVKQWDVDTTKAQTTADGLKYIIIKEGTGENPDSGDVVSVHYSGYLTDGTRFDSSVEKDEPLVFTLGRSQVIKGWDDGIALLKKGGKAKLIIPPSLGFGPQGSGPIPPNSTLIFDIELVDIK